MAKKGKSKISKVKRSNQTTNKMAKQGKSKLQRHRQKQPQKQRPPQKEPSSEESETDMMDMVDEEELAYLRRRAKTGTLLSSVPKENEISKEKPPKVPRRKRRVSGSDSELEERYEADAEGGRGLQAAKKMKPLLPIKTKEGIVAMEVETDASSEEESEPEPPPPAEVEEAGSEDEEEETPGEALQLFEEQQTLSAADLLVARRLELREKKYKIGTLSSGLLESPEKKLRNFYPLFALMEEKTKDDTANLVSVRKLATLSVYEVFKDILPEYPIKHQDYSNVKLKKDTLSLYKHEKELLEFYKRFLQRLERAANVLRRKRGDNRRPEPALYKLGLMSLQCMCGMLVERPYFNFAPNICQTVVPFLNNRDPEARRSVSECCKSVFAEDRKGEISLTLVRRINHLVKSRSNNVHPDTLSCLLTLRIKDVDLDAEKRIDIKQKTEEQKKKRLINMSKKERKRNKKLKEVESELMETQAEESRLTKQKHLTEITKTVFMIYFRVLKNFPQSALLSATLEGLSRFAHVINLEYYSDLVGILSHLLENTSIGARQRLHCVQTVFAILSGQGDALNIDPTKFYSYFYESLLTIHAGKTHNDMPVILDTMESIVVKRRRKISVQVLLAYVKRLATLALQTQHNGALACLELIKTVAQHSKAIDMLLQLDESVGSGRYDGQLQEPEYCGANATALYECARLQRHYHPGVRRMATHVARGAPASGEGSLPADMAKLSAEQLFKQYDGSQMAFKPSIPVPQKVQPKKRVATVHTFTVPAFHEYCEQLLTNVTTCDFSDVMRNGIKTL